MHSTPHSASQARALRRFGVFVLGLTAIVVLGVSLPQPRHAHAAAVAQQSGNWHSGSCDDQGNRWGGWDGARACQMRQTSFALPTGHLSVNTTNGGIHVTGEDRPDVALEARVQVWAPSESAANDLLRQIVIQTTNGAVRDQGPHSTSFFFSHTRYRVDYDLRVPRHLAAELHTTNGGIELARLEGPLRFQTTNGAVHLDRLAGDVQGSTVNGKLEIELAGNGWRGEGLRADTTNGHINLRIPEGYSAHLEAGTVNGGVEMQFPITVQGEIRHTLDTNLGSGGATIHTHTVNGGVTVTHTSSEAAD